MAVKSCPLDKIAYKDYYAYATETIEDQYVIGNLDGLKPVARRSLYAIFKLGLNSSAKHDKSAKAVGATIANYHPHGDSSCYGAMVTAANTAVKMIDGKGNFGTMMERKAGAHRYTNLRLSKYADLCFFDRFYLPVMRTVDNYDGSKKEPLNLPCMLPNALLNPAFGMGAGVRTESIGFTAKSVVKVIQDVIDAGGKVTPELCAGLNPISEYGGHMRLTKEDRREFRTMIKSGKGTIFLEPAYVKEESKKGTSIRMHSFGALPKDLANVFAKAGRIAGVARVEDDGTENDHYQTAIKVGFKSSCKGKELEQAIAKVIDNFTVKYTIDVKVTDRIPLKGGLHKIELRNSNPVTQLGDWLAYRVKLEQRACKYWIGKRNQQISELELYIKAISHLDVIRAALDEDDSEAYLVKHLKITLEDAKFIMGRTLNQLKRLEMKKLKAEILALKEEISGYEKRIEKPLKYIREHVGKILDQLKNEIKRQSFA
jgi:DNA gyrase/topoisomerase IV subunit A